MSWRKINIKFAGTCVVCGKRVEANTTGLWAKDVGIKHEGCAQAATIDCIICGAPAGCTECEFGEDCDTEKVSQPCICKRCGDTPDPFGPYRAAAGKKFRLLNTT